MTTKQTLSLNQPLKFLGSTVISFNMSLGYGASSESTLTVDLVDDCGIDGNEQPMFLPLISGQTNFVGMPVFFPDNPAEMPACTFGGILANWTVQQSSSGKTYNVTVKDPRQLLENTLIIIDSVVTGPIYHVNYYNAYAYWEQNIIYTNTCVNYGLSNSNEKGMTYYNIIETLKLMNIDLYPSTYGIYPYVFRVDFNTFPGVALGTRSLPQWYRVAGPGISILQLLEDICNVLAYDFFVYLIKNENNEYIIKIGLIDLNVPPASFVNILDAFGPTATDISYGQEFRNEKSKMVILGDNIHYLMPAKASSMAFCFGTEEILDLYGVVQTIPIIPYGYDDCGFWINKRIHSLNVSLAYPLPTNGPYQISELDIRAAMSSYEMWLSRAFDINTPGTFNMALRTLHPQAVTNLQLVLNSLAQIDAALDNTRAISKNLTDTMNNPSSAITYRNYPKVVEDFKKIHAFLNNLGSTYYGKEFLVQLDNQKVCKKYDSETNTYVYTDTPTNNGGWVDASFPVLGLNEPWLSHFRTSDQRIKGFARFALAYDINTVNQYATQVSEQNVGQNVNQSGTHVRLSKFSVEGPSRPF